MARDLIQGAEPLGQAWRSIVKVLIHNGEGDLAVAALDRLLQETGKPEIAFEKAALLARFGNPRAAVAIINTLPGQAIDEIQRQHFLATAEMEMGDLSEARQRFAFVVDKAPHLGIAWYSLLSILPKADRAEWLPKAQKFRGQSNRFPPEQLGPFLYATAMMLDAEEKWADAFQTFSDAGQVMSLLRPYDPAADAWRLQRVFRSQGWQDMPAKPDPKDMPIFVIGIPRSGSTLVEQILASHSAVAGGGELNIMKIVLPEIGKAGLDSSRRAELAILYDRLARQHVRSPGCIIDKTLDAGRHVEAIVDLFPSAPIIWVRRDPLSVAWSAFRTYFAQGIPWSFSLNSIAKHLRLEDQLYAFWRRRRRDQILTINYEELVRQPATIIDSMLRHCGLETETAVFAPHNTSRVVRTASVAQVREAISPDAIEVPSQYHGHLTPFLQTYDAIDANG